MVIGESVLLEQWPHTLKLVNAPTNVTLLNPGQCIRIGVYASGDSRDSYIEKTKLAFRVRFAGQIQDHALAPLAQIKQIKPEGGDFVTGALAAAGIKNPLTTLVTLGASADKWCVPADAQDGKAVIEAEIESPAGHQKQKPAEVQIESFETGSRKSFKSLQESSDFSQTYYRQPNPARLLPMLQNALDAEKAKPQSGVFGIAVVSLRAALKAEPVAAQDFLARMATQEKTTQAIGLFALRAAGYDISSVLKTLSAAEQQSIQSASPMPDLYNLEPTAAIGNQLDLLWATFGATGQIEPMKTIASTLVWRSDYDAYDKMRKSGTRPSEITPSLARALGYRAAGWSMGSFQMTDPLAADYIEYMLASADTPETIKSELKALSTNPAFKRDSQK